MLTYRIQLPTATQQKSEQPSPRRQWLDLKPSSATRCCVTTGGPLTSLDIHLPRGTCKQSSTYGLCTHTCAPTCRLTSHSSGDSQPQSENVKWKIPETICNFPIILRCPSHLCHTAGGLLGSLLRFQMHGGGTVGQGTGGPLAAVYPIPLIPLPGAHCGRPSTASRHTKGRATPAT